CLTCCRDWRRCAASGSACGKSRASSSTGQSIFPRPRHSTCSECPLKSESLRRESCTSALPILSCRHSQTSHSSVLRGFAHFCARHFCPAPAPRHFLRVATLAAKTRG